MKLWMVRDTGQVGYDRYDSFVVRAATVEEARESVAEYASDDWDPPIGEYWRTSPLVTVTEVTADGEPEVILGSFNAG